MIKKVNLLNKGISYMNKGTIPAIYTKGTFKLKSPLSNHIKKDVIYTVVSVRTISDIILSGEDCYYDYYHPLGLDESIYREHQINNLSIIGIKSTADIVKYFPQSYLEYMPVGSGVKYDISGLGIDLGPLPEGYNLEPLIKDVATLVKRHIGINPLIQKVILSEDRLVSFDDHKYISEKRKMAADRYIKEQGPDKEELKEELRRYKKTLKDLIPEIEKLKNKTS